MKPGKEQKFFLIEKEYRYHYLYHYLIQDNLNHIDGKKPRIFSYNDLEEYLSQKVLEGETYSSEKICQMDPRHPAQADWHQFYHYKNCSIFTQRSSAGGGSAEYFSLKVASGDKSQAESVFNELEKVLITEKQ